MHIPDGFLSPEVAGVTDVIAYSIFALSVKKISRINDIEKIPRLGLTGAFVFAAGMFSFPVPGGTSAHLTGATLACVLLGTFEGYFVFAVALLLQALLFQHGGLITSGANLLNMAFFPLILAGGVRKILYRHINTGAFLAGIIAGASVFTGAFLCSLELALSGTSDFYPTLTAMLVAHIPPAVLEGAVTISLLRGVWKKWNNSNLSSVSKM